VFLYSLRIIGRRDRRRSIIVLIEC
uniref:Uncharacterized protein n=1 Tax=Amphimedon queenslandica TaxID=400682 RepID=A0A1X7T5C9_AMPQE